jgi:hypothetical protein
LTLPADALGFIQGYVVQSQNKEVAAVLSIYPAFTHEKLVDLLDRETPRSAKCVSRARFWIGCSTMARSARRLAMDDVWAK